MPGLQLSFWINENKKSFITNIRNHSRAHASAKPLSYVGGTMAMQENDETGHTLSLDYTFTPTEAFGIYVKQERNGRDILMLTPQINTLLKRWNLPERTRKHL